MLIDFNTIEKKDNSVILRINLSHIYHNLYHISKRGNHDSFLGDEIYFSEPYIYFLYPSEGYLHYQFLLVQLYGLLFTFSFSMASKDL